MLLNGMLTITKRSKVLSMFLRHLYMAKGGLLEDFLLIFPCDYYIQFQARMESASVIDVFTLGANTQTHQEN